jgi:hypothetical protein
MSRQLASEPMARLLSAPAFVCASTFFLLISPCLHSSTGPALAEPLRGSIEQYDVAKGWIPAERLPLADWEKTVAPRLKSGLAWSDKLLPEQGVDAKWVPIPDWLAGHWHIARARFVLDKTGLESSEALNLEDDIFGYQQDKNGGYWELVRNPVTNVTEGDDFYSRFVHYEQTGSMKTPTQYVLESDNLEVRVSKKNGRIASVRKRHDVYSWTMTASGVEANDQVQFLDRGMKPKESGSGTVKTRPIKIGPYLRVDITGDGFKARESFKLFLEKNGMNQLIPLD